MQADREAVRLQISRKKQFLASEYRRRDDLQKEYEAQLKDCDDTIERLEHELEDLQGNSSAGDLFSRRMAADDHEAAYQRGHTSYSTAHSGRLEPRNPPPGFESRRVEQYSGSSDEAEEPHELVAPRRVPTRQPPARSPMKPKTTARAPVQLYVPGARRRVDGAQASPAAHSPAPHQNGDGLPRMGGLPPPPGYSLSPNVNEAARAASSPPLANGIYSSERLAHPEKQPEAHQGSAELAESVNARRGSWDTIAKEEDERAQAAYQSFRNPALDPPAVPLESAHPSHSEIEATRQDINADINRIVLHQDEQLDSKLAGTEPASRHADSTGRDAGEVAVTRKVREWDLDKAADPQKELWESRTREHLSWGDDDPNSPHVGNVAGREAGPSGSRSKSGRFAEEFPGLFTGKQPSPEQKEWMRDQGRRSEEFPSLGGIAPAGPATSAWAANNIKDRLTDGRPFSRQAAPASTGPQIGVEVIERNSGLRHPTEERSDAELKKQMSSKKDFEYVEWVRGREVNVVEGLELHKSVLTDVEQVILEQAITHWVEQGMQQKLRGRTFSAPRKWAKGKGRITVQFGCCYNYATDTQGRRPGIIAEEVVEPMPPVLIALVQRLVRWGVLPKSQEPDSAIVNIYEPDDCIPPHIDHHDFNRPFCTISLLSEEKIMFGSRLVPEGPGVFHGVNNAHTFISLPVGSCLVLKGNGADVAMHCVPPVSARRMSITLRKMGNMHASAVRAEAARGTARNRSEPSGIPPPRNQVSLADLITVRTRGSASRDAQRETRWSEEADDKRSERW